VPSTKSSRSIILRLEAKAILASIPTSRHTSLPPLTPSRSRSERADLLSCKARHW
jgi:hypothetical protein